jgi:hypothetical protein
MKHGFGRNCRKRNITYKSTYVCVYANDVIARNITTLKAVLLALGTRSRKMGLRTNKKETTYIKMSATQATRYLKNLTINDFKFEGNDSFTYLG